jgi:hypothetical protein
MPGILAHFTLVSFVVLSTGNQIIAVLPSAKEKF